MMKLKTLTRHPIFERAGKKLKTGIFGLSALLILSLFANFILYQRAVELTVKNQPPSLGRNKVYIRNSGKDPLIVDQIILSSEDQYHPENKKQFVISHNFDLPAGQTVIRSVTINGLNIAKNRLLIRLKEPESSSSTVLVKFNEPFDVSEGVEFNLEATESYCQIEIAEGSSEAAANISSFLLHGESKGGEEIKARIYARHLLGTDCNGFDIFSRVLVASRPAFVIAGFSVILMLLVSLPLGICAGFFGNMIEVGILRLADACSAIPRFLLILIITMLWGRTLPVIAFAIGVTSWMEPTRVFHSKTKIIMQQDYITSAISTGRSQVHIMIYDIMPNLLPHIIVSVAAGMSAAIIFESALSFLGLGIIKTTPSWGNILADSLNGRIRSWQVFFPSVALIWVILSLNAFADGIQTAINRHRRR